MLLRGLKVVELATHIAGPALGAMMADWGADVIKVEGAAGNPIRYIRPPARPGGAPANFELDNRGKRAIALDYRTPGGRAALLALVARADVFITTVRPASLARAQLDYPSLSQLNPQLVYGSLSGYGLTAAAADMPAFDITAFWARSGIGALLPRPDGSPGGGRAGMGDHIAALTLAVGVMTALVARARTGQGALVDASLFRAGQYAISYDIAEYLRRGEVMPAAQSDRRHMTWASNYCSGDGHWFCVHAHDPLRDYNSIFAAAGLTGLKDDARFQSPEARVANGPALIALLDAGFAARTMAKIAQDLDARGLIWAPFQTLDQVVADPIAHAAGSFVQVKDGNGGAFALPAAPVDISGAGERILEPVPSIGQHTDDVLAELGYDETAIATLRRAGAVF